MDTVATVGSLLNTKGHSVWGVSPDITVFEALRLMAEKNVGALLVMHGDRLAGIVSERDYARKVALAGKSSQTTLVREILTEAVHRVSPTTTVAECMALMTDKRVRHLPVVDNERVVGVISIGDLVNWIIHTQKAAIDQLEAYIAGGYPA